ncbi:caveolin-3-like [Lineus longissimus]|uniref:caveolin-3-like n=1 Tax=Lineus longissimus TaxID=88925 RepID=UPI002B4E586B
MGEDIKLTVEGESTSPAFESRNIDVGQRDPLNINDHLKVTFEDIIAEPEQTTYSFDKVWILSYKVFTSTKLWCYRITSLLCAIPAMIFWGIYFACLAFCTIWCCVPCYKAFGIELHCAKKIFQTVLGAFYEPCWAAIGKCWSNIRVTMVKE